MDTTRAARAAAADFLNCTSEEVTFGHNMTTLTYHLAHAIFSQAAGQRQGSAGPAVVGPGDNIVLSRLEHDANAGPWERLGREVAGCEIRWIPLVEGTAELDLSVLGTLIDERTKVSGWRCTTELVLLRVLLRVLLLVLSLV